MAESLTVHSGVKRERDSYYYSVHPYAFISDYGGLLMRNYRASYGLLDYNGVLQPSKMSDGYNPTYSHTNSMQKDTDGLPKPAVWTGLLNYQRQYPYELRRKRHSRLYSSKQQQDQLHLKLTPLRRQTRVN